jgi:hypothetical protein
MKGQLSYIIKPITLVMIIVLLFLLYQSLSETSAKEKDAQKSLNTISGTTDVLLVLANSPDCLAYRTITESLYSNVLDINKLDEFSKKYESIEPECARSYEFGWRATVYEVGRNSLPMGANWTFGTKEFSTGDALKDTVVLSMPVAIRYSQKTISPGKIEVKFVDGELEKIAGFIDWSCELGKRNRPAQSSFSVYLHGTMSYNAVDNTLCLTPSGSNKVSCRQMICQLDFSGLKSPGEHMLSLSYSNGRIVIA